MIQYVYFTSKKEKNDLIEFVKTLQAKKNADQQKLDRLMLCVIGTEIEDEDYTVN